MARFSAGKALPPDTIMFCGTLGAKGGIRPADALRDGARGPGRGARMSHGYDVADLPVIT